jgi:hypothetical protein
MRVELFWEDTLETLQEKMNAFLEQLSGKVKSASFTPDPEGWSAMILYDPCS